MTLRDALRPELGELRAYHVPTPPAPGVAKLDANESPWPLGEGARRRLADRLAAIPLERYPDARATDLRAAIAATLACHGDELVIGCGSDEVISLLCTALSRPRIGQTRASVLYPTPTFVMFRVTALGHGLHPVEVPLAADLQLDVPAMRAAIERERPRIVFLATPNNPTGAAYRDDDLRAVIAAADDSLVVIDEAYAAFAGRSLSAWCDTHANVALLGTLSKIGLAGARVGWARLPRGLACEVDKVRQPFNLPALSQVAATLALTELREEFAAHVAAIIAERNRLARALPELRGLRVFPTDANFFFVKPERDAEQVASSLAARDVWVRTFPAHGALRMTVGTPDENDRLLTALYESLGV